MRSDVSLRQRLTNAPRSARCQGHLCSNGREFFTTDDVDGGEKGEQNEQDRKINVMLPREETVKCTTTDEKREVRFTDVQKIYLKRKTMPSRSSDCQLNRFEAISARIDRRVIRQIIDPNAKDTHTSVP